MLKPFKNPRTGIYYYRKTIPKSLRDVIGKTEILVSLKTTNIREAMPQFYEEALRADRLITTAREGDCIDTTLDFSNLSNYDFGDRPPEWEIEEEVRETLQDLFDAYSNNSAKSPSSLDAFKHAIKLFCELHGEMNATDITRPMVREYKDALLLVPSSRSGLGDYTLPELVRHSINNKVNIFISPSTVNKNIKGISAVISWAERNGYFDDCPNWSNPASGVRADVNNTKTKRQPFDDNDLSKIFCNRYKQLSGSKYWIPLISLYSGARLEEIGQLLISDIKQKADIWYFDITDEDGSKSLKNASAKRIVPIHNTLIKLGFLDFLSDGEKVFEELTPSKAGKLTPKVSKWFGVYKRSVGVTSAQKTFHSFRHLVKDALRNSGVDEAISDALTGHTNGSVGRQYGKGYKLEVLNKAIQSIKYDIDVDWL